MAKSGISYIDLGIIVVLLFFIVKGYKSGFTNEFMRIGGTIISLILAVRYMSDISLPLVGAINISPIAAIVVAFGLIFIGSILLFKFITERIQKAIKFSFALGSADKIVGGALGLFKGSIIISLLATVISVFSLSSSIQRQISESMLFDPMRRIAPLVYDTFKILAPSPKSFFVEFNENFSGIHKERIGKDTQNLIEFYKKK